MRSSKALLMVFAATVVLSVTAATALASRGIELSVSEGSLNDINMRSSVTFTDERREFTVVCEFQKDFSFNRTLLKVAGSEAGVVRLGTTGCTGGVMRQLIRGEAWPVTYQGFGGTLPGITEVKLNIGNYGFLLETFLGAARCLYGSNLRESAVGSPITEFRFDERWAVPLVASLGIAFCPPNVFLRGTLRARPTVRMRLI